MNASNPFAARLAAAAAATQGTARRDRLDSVEIVEGGAFHFTAPANDGITARQHEVVKAMLTCRNFAGEQRPAWKARIRDMATVEGTISAMTKAQASAFIDYAKTMPMLGRKHASDATVPEGLYAVEIDIEGLIFVKVDHGSGKWHGYTFVTRQVGSDFVRVNRRVADAALAGIRKEGFKESSIRYGHELGHCGRCGRELTNEASREAGIGPICAGKDW